VTPIIMVLWFHDEETCNHDRTNNESTE